jgi:thiol-disulfide isomerase/thioredoxin
MMLVANNDENEFLGSKNIIGSIGLDQFEEKVLKEVYPVLVLCLYHESEFQEQIRIIEEIYQTYVQKMKVYLLEEEALGAFNEKFAVKGTPTFLLFINGNEKGRILGRADSKVLNDFLSRMLQL